MLRYLSLAALLLGATFPTYAAADAWEVFAWGDGSSYGAVFNAVSAFSGQDSYRGLIKAVMLLIAMVMLMFSAWHNLPEFLRWIVQSLTLFYVLCLPVSNVVIVDKLNSDAPIAVSNVPWTLALSASLISRTSFWMTDKMEALLSVPSDIRVSQNGYRFGQRALSTALGVAIEDRVLAGDLKNYFANCVVPEASRVPSTAKAIFDGTDDSWDAVWAAGNPMLPTTLSDGDNTLTVSCQAAAVGGAFGLDAVSADKSLKSRVNAELVKRQIAAGAALRPYITDKTFAASLFLDNMDIIKDKFLQSTASANDVMRQALFVNYWNATRGDLASMYASPDKAQMAFAETQAQMQAIQQYRVQGRLARDTLPKFRNMVELIIIILFPIMVIYVIAAGHNGLAPLRGWFMGLVWVGLWPPLYAISNFFGIRHDSLAITNIFNTGTQAALSVASVPDAMLTLAQAEADSSTIVLAITAIAAVIAKGFDFAASPVMSGMMANMVSSGASTGAANALGNDRIRQGATDTVGLQGQAFRETRSGISLMMDQQTGRITDATNAGVQMRVSGQQAAALDTAAKSAREAGQSAGMASSASTTAAMGNVMKFSRSHDMTLSNDAMAKHNLSSEEANAFRRQVDLAKRVSQAWGTDETTAMEIAGGAKIPLTDIGAKINHKNAEHTKLLTDLGSVSKASHDRSTKYAEAAVQEWAATHKETAKDTNLVEASRSFATANEARTTAEAHYRRADSFEESARQTRQASASVDQDATTLFVQRLQTALGGSAELTHRMLENHKNNAMTSGEYEIFDRVKADTTTELLAREQATLGISAPVDRTEEKRKEYAATVPTAAAVRAEDAKNVQAVRAKASGSGLDADTAMSTVGAAVERLEKNVKAADGSRTEKVDAGGEKLTANIYRQRQEAGAHYRRTPVDNPMADPAPNGFAMKLPAGSLVEQIPGEGPGRDAPSPSPAPNSTPAPSAKGSATPAVPATPALAAATSSTAPAAPAKATSSNGDSLVDKIPR